MLTPALPTYIANETIPAGARVKFVAGSVTRVELADAGDVEIGTAILHSGKSSYAADEGVTVSLVNNPGGRTLLAAGAFAVGATLYRVADGKVDDSGTGEAIAIALEASTASGDMVDAIFIPATASGSSAAGAADGLSSLRVARATFDPSTNAGERTIGAHGLGVTLPDDAIVFGFVYDVNTTFTSATDAATIAIHAEGANDLLAAIAISDATNMWDAGRHAGKPGYPNLGADAAHDTQPEVAALFAATFLKLTAARELTATVAVEALTAGKATFYVFYLPGA